MWVCGHEKAVENSWQDYGDFISYQFPALVILPRSLTLVVLANTPEFTNFSLSCEHTLTLNSYYFDITYFVLICS